MSDDDILGLSGEAKRRLLDDMDAAHVFRKLVAATSEGNTLRFNDREEGFEVEEIPKHVGDPDPDTLGRFFKTFVVRGQESGDVFRLKYRGTSTPTFYVQEAETEQDAMGSREWSPVRQVRTLTVEGNGITHRKERVGYTPDEFPDRNDLEQVTASNQNETQEGNHA